MHTADVGQVGDAPDFVVLESDVGQAHLAGLHVLAPEEGHLLQPVAVQVDGRQRADVEGLHCGDLVLLGVEPDERGEVLLLYP